MMSRLLEEKIIESYKVNAMAWSNIIANEGIESRKLITNNAIKSVILACQPKKILDVGCGEGWLVRAMVRLGIDATGIDGVSELIDKAREYNCGKFEVCNYQQINQCKAIHADYDVIVCNFSLLGQQSSVDMLISCRDMLSHSAGRIIIQTLHPCFTFEEELYQDGWKEGSWNGFPSSFTQPPSWYYRTLQSWITLFVSAGLALINVIEPINQGGNKPTSIIFECQKAV